MQDKKKKKKRYKKKEIEKRKKENTKNKKRKRRRRRRRRRRRKEEKKKTSFTTEISQTDQKLTRIHKIRLCNIETITQFAGFLFWRPLCLVGFSEKLKR